jgi:hypothetical protein
MRQNRGMSSAVWTCYLNRADFVGLWKYLRYGRRLNDCSTNHVVFTTVQPITSYLRLFNQSRRLHDCSTNQVVFTTVQPIRSCLRLFNQSRRIYGMINQSTRLFDYLTNHVVFMPIQLIRSSSTVQPIRSSSTVQPITTFCHFFWQTRIRHPRLSLNILWS